jgi:hypothetical protein
VFERLKTVHASVVGRNNIRNSKIFLRIRKRVSRNNIRSLSPFTCSHLILPVSWTVVDTDSMLVDYAGASRALVCPLPRTSPKPQPVAVGTILPQIVANAGTPAAGTLAIGRTAGA